MFYYKSINYNVDQKKAILQQLSFLYSKIYTLTHRIILKFSKNFNLKKTTMSGSTKAYIWLIIPSIIIKYSTHCPVSLCVTVVSTEASGEKEFFGAPLFKPARRTSPCILSGRTKHTIEEYTHRYCFVIRNGTARF